MESNFSTMFCSIHKLHSDMTSYICLWCQIFFYAMAKRLKPIHLAPFVLCEDKVLLFRYINRHRQQQHWTQRFKPRVATRSPNTSSGTTGPVWSRRSSSVTGLLSTWLLRDLSLFRTPPPAFRSRGGAAVLCPETFSATGASLWALVSLILDSPRLLSLWRSALCPVSPVWKMLQDLEEDGVEDVECRENCRRTVKLFVSDARRTVVMTTSVTSGGGDAVGESYHQGALDTATPLSSDYWRL